MITNDEVALLAQRTADANKALVRGDADGYLALTEHGDDYTLMAPFGGEPRRGFDTSSEYKAGLARFFRSGTLDQEVVATYASGDLAVLVTMERIRGAFGGLPEQPWTLRVTQVFRRDGAGWLLVHRHADPLTGTLGLEQAAALARGEER
jgi:ketosteroid isomerase-like protein